MLNKIIISIAVIVMFGVPPTTSMSQTQPITLDKLQWISGSWRLEKNDRVTEEQWMKPAGQMMLGMSRTVIAGKTFEYEFIVLKQDTTGDIYYVANPSKQTQTEFKLIKSSEGEAVFENLEHDFPQRIIYRKQGADSLIARIEGMSKGKLKGIDFPMRKVTED